MSLRHSILGFLSIQPFTGYDLKKAFDSSVRHFWAADQAQIYRALAELEAMGWVWQERVAQTARPDRKLFHLTESGKIELNRWLIAPTEGVVRREPFLVKLFFIPVERPDLLRQVVEQEMVEVRAERQGLEQIGEGLREVQALGPVLTLWSGIHAARAYEDWLGELLDRVGRGPVSTRDIWEWSRR